MDKSVKTLIMKAKKWLKKKAAIISLALANVEKNAIGQNKEELEANTKQEQRHNQGTLADALLRGELTQEVIDLRWRMYKIMGASANLRTKISIGEDGEPIVEGITEKERKNINDIVVDNVDTYKLELVFYNKEISKSNADVMNDILSNLSDAKPTKTIDEDGNEITVHGSVSAEGFMVASKGEKPLKVERNLMAKFNIEDYTTHLNVRHIDDENKLLEFCVNKTPDEDNRTSKLFISDMKKTIQNPRFGTFLEINKVKFITNDETVGTPNNFEYEYEIKSFDKIIEFNDLYVIKYKAKPIINGVDITAKFISEELEVKYKNKEKKKKKPF